MQQKFLTEYLAVGLGNDGMNAFCIPKYIRSPAISTTSQVNLVIRSNLAFVLYVLSDNVLNHFTGNKVRDLIGVTR